MTTGINLSDKQSFRDENCNIVTMGKSKNALVPKGYEILQPLQSLEEFNKVLDSKNWAFTQTNNSNIIFVDADYNNHDKKLNKFFNRRRDRYENHSERINSKHGFLKVTDVNHEWCVKFARKNHLKSGIEIYAEKHWGIFAGKYYNSKNSDDPKRETTWYPLDDLHLDPIINVTKKDLEDVFGIIQLDDSGNESTKARKTTEELIKPNWPIGERYSNGRDLALRRFHSGWVLKQIQEEAYGINKSLHDAKSLEEVDAWIKSGHELYEKNIKDPNNEYFPIIENHTVNTFETAYSLLQELNRKEALVEFLKTFKDKKDTELKTTFKQAEKKLKREYEKDQAQYNEKAFTNENFDLVAQIIQDGNHILTIRETKEMWIYDETEGVYRALGDTFIAEECQKIVHKCNRKTVGEVIETIKRNQTMINEKSLLDSREINTQNGILDPDTFELKPHSHEYLTTTKLPFSVDFEARNFKLWRHILTIIDPKDINLIMELIWINISWNNPFKKMFVFKGVTNTQKSTLADILVWIIGSKNVSREKPSSFLHTNSKFSTSKFIGKRMNIASEIGNLDSDMLENQKSLVGAELQNTERKNDNTERYFDPTRFVFLYTTNKLGSIYSSINDNSVITRFQFLIFRNQIDDDKTNGQWYDSFFRNEEDKQSAINTVVKLVIAYKKSQVFGSTPRTKWSGIEETKKILKEQMPKEDKYFEDERIIENNGSKLTLQEIQKDFESFTGHRFRPQVMGFILKRQGFKSKQSNSVTYYPNISFNTEKDQTKLIQ